MSRLLLIHPVSESSIMSRAVRPFGFRSPTSKVGDNVFGRILTEADIAAREPPKKIEPQPIELTPGQQIALLTLRKSQLAKAILQKLFHSTARPSHQDTLDLVHLGFAEGTGKGDYRITYPGQVHANILACKLAVELGINPHAFDVKRHRGLFVPGVPMQTW